MDSFAFAHQCCLFLALVPVEMGVVSACTMDLWVMFVAFTEFLHIALIISIC